MTIASIITLLLQILPTLLDDGVKAVAVLNASSAAINRAQAGDGTVSAEDFAALDATVNGDMAVLAAAAGITVPTA